MVDAIVFDWDDTLLFTDWIMKHGVLGEGPFTIEFMEHCKMLEASINVLVTEAKKYGPVYIVTSAEPGWVEFSIARYIPTVVLDDVRIVAVKTERDPQRIKNFAFTMIVNELNPTSLTVVGDSCYEHGALDYVKKFMPRKTHRSIKFIKNPSCTDLIQQHVKCIKTLKCIMGLECNWCEIYN